MYQTLKCDPTLIDNPTGSGCGEWDAGANFILYHHDFVDSLAYDLGSAFPDTVALVNNPTYNYYQQYQYFIGYNSTISEANYAVGSGSVGVNNTFNDVNASNKAQYLWTAAELSAAGLSAGTIDKLEMDFTGLGSTLSYLKINMKHSALTTLSETSYETTGFSEVYNINTSFASLGLNTINLTTPFVWDGTSNVVMEFTFSNPAPSAGHVLNGENTASNMNIHSTIDDGYLDFSGNGDYVDVPDMDMDFSNGFSVSAWVYYDGYNAWSRILDCYDADLKNGFQFSNQGTSKQP